nr:unnamed protein product [Callosobruchus chinensis]
MRILGVTRRRINAIEKNLFLTSVPPKENTEGDRKTGIRCNHRPETLPVIHSYFRHIFNTCYNLGFGTPRTDVCSTFLSLSEKIKPCKDLATKKSLEIEKRLHKLRAKIKRQNE